MSVCREMPACAGMTEVGLSANDQKLPLVFANAIAKTGHSVPMVEETYAP